MSDIFYTIIGIAVIISAIGIFKNEDIENPLYGTILFIVGWFIVAYHLSHLFGWE